ncbi:MerR family transcriptional regulator [Bailinhaonella thermotolerans]|uniref:MerR family DNA-binding transcriptional regulator n=1 Tax=Bailinhaonella thermotolerans TaxID=1070861 RepID=A0A3A4AJ35_9ACTN|nr:MerR family transcriptional regulator [Bailinhaonella thermotolerans]RJL20830.1 MerR family DNA-binding transcriptional regulator [Bailinhaonella thermotolerans]
MSAQAARSHMSIGEVLAQLQGEFPDVTISKIRFLEAEGLIEPQRSPSGYRKFTHADVERLRFILTAQRDRYLPLRVIKDHLEAADRGESGEWPRPRAVPAAPAAPAEVRLSRAELIDAAGIGEDLLTELEDYGLIEAVARRYDGEALAVARSAVALARFGLHARHLRAVKAAAERETSLVEQAVAPLLRQRNPGARDRAGETAREIENLMLDLHTALMRTGLRRNLSG